MQPPAARARRGRGAVTPPGKISHVPLRLQHQAAGHDGRDHHRADVPGPARAEEAARQPDPRRRAAGDGGQHSRIRAPRPRRSSARSSTASRSRCRASRRSTRSARRPRESSAQIVIIFNFKKNMVEAARRDPQRHRLGAPQAADRDARAGAVRASTRRPQPIMQLALSSHDADARRDLAPGRGRARRPLPRASTAWPSSTSTARCAASCRCCCAREKLREYNVSVGRGGERAARAEHHRAGGPRARARSTSRASAWSGRIESPARVRRHRGQAPRQRDRAPGPGGHRRGRLRRARQLQPAQRQPERRHLGHRARATPAR